MIRNHELRGCMESRLELYEFLIEGFAVNQDEIHSRDVVRLLEPEIITVSILPRAHFSPITINIFSFHAICAHFSADGEQHFPGEAKEKY